MSKLSTGARKALPAKDFAGPDRSYPVENKAHARAAEMDAGAAERAGRMTAAERARIDARAHAALKRK